MLILSDSLSQETSAGLRILKAFLEHLLPLHECCIGEFAFLFEFSFRLLVVCKMLCCLRSCDWVKLVQTAAGTITQHRPVSETTIGAFQPVCWFAVTQTLWASASHSVKHMSENTVAMALASDICTHTLAARTFTLSAAVWLLTP